VQLRPRYQTLIGEHCDRCHTLSRAHKASESGSIATLETPVTDQQRPESRAVGNPGYTAHLPEPLVADIADSRPGALRRILRWLRG